MSSDQIPDVLVAMVLAGYEVRLTFNALAIDMPYTCHTYKVAHGENESPWSHGAHGNRLTEAVAKSWKAVQEGVA